MMLKVQSLTFTCPESILMDLRGATNKVAHELP